MNPEELFIQWSERSMSNVGIALAVPVVPAILMMVYNLNITADKVIEYMWF